MQRIDIRSRDPERYARVKAEQAELYKLIAGKPTLARICPYCKHKQTEVVQGNHGFDMMKCERCGEDSIHPPVSFRKAK